MYIISRAIICALAILNLYSCCKRNITSSPVITSAPDSTGQTDLKLVEATVIDYREVDGCSFLLEMNDGAKLQPENLPSEFQINRMKVLIKYHLTDRMTVCMAGKTVYLDFIKIKKE